MTQPEVPWYLERARSAVHPDARVSRSERLGTFNGVVASIFKSKDYWMCEPAPMLRPERGVKQPDFVVTKATEHLDLDVYHLYVELTNRDEPALSHMERMRAYMARIHQSIAPDFTLPVVVMLVYGHETFVWYVTQAFVADRSSKELLAEGEENMVESYGEAMLGILRDIALRD